MKDLNELAMRQLIFIKAKIECLFLPYWDNML